MDSANNGQTTVKIVSFWVTTFSPTPKPEIAELSREIKELISGWAARHEYGSCCFEYHVEDITDQANKDLADIAKQDQEDARNVAS